IIDHQSSTSHSTHLILLMPRTPPIPTLFPYTTLFRSQPRGTLRGGGRSARRDGRRVGQPIRRQERRPAHEDPRGDRLRTRGRLRAEEHTYELQSRENLVCRLLLEKKNESRTILEKKIR